MLSALVFQETALSLTGILDFLAAEISHPGLAALTGSLIGDAELRTGLRSLPAAGAGAIDPAMLDAATANAATPAATSPRLLVLLTICTMNSCSLVSQAKPS